MKTHDPLTAIAAFWFAILSPLIGIIIGLLGAWLVSQPKHSDLLQETLRRKKAIREWITRTIQKYKLHFNPLSVTDNSAEIVVAV